MSNQQNALPPSKRTGWIVFGVIAALLLSGLAVLLVRTSGSDDKADAGPTKATAPVSSTPPDGTYCYGCFYTTTPSAFEAQAEAKGYRCEAEGAGAECTKGMGAVLSFQPSVRHPTRLGRLAIQTFTPGPPDRKQGNALATAATNAELKALLAQLFVDPEIHKAVLQWFTTSFTYGDCDPMTLTGFRLSCTEPKTASITERSVTWSSSAAIEGEYNR